MNKKTYNEGLTDGKKGKPCKYRNPDYMRGHIAGMELYNKNVDSINRMLDTIERFDNDA